MNKRNDFTESVYRDLIRLAKERFEFATFATRPEHCHVLWRHDVDLSVHRALKLAEIEYEEGVQSTYFFLLHSHYYNVFESEVCRMAKQIVNLGHQVGLHFDFKFYEGQDLATHFVEFLEKEKMILQDLLDSSVVAVSYHNPSPLDLENYDADKLNGMINAYGASLRSEYSYCSDSNGYWRFRCLRDVLVDPEVRKLQVLTHPEWWTPEPLSPRERVSRCIDGRSRYQHARYDRMLAEMGRENVR